MISFVIPLYNEEVLVNKLLARTFSAMHQTNEKFEVICVDDGSTDQTLHRLKEFRKANTELKILVLSRNFGHQAAYTAGLSYAKGD